MKCFQRVVSCFIRLGNNDGQRWFEMSWPVTYVDTCISNVNNIEKVYLIFDNSFKMFP